MSIYASFKGFGYEHTHRCARIKRLERGIYEQDDSKPCTCGSCPIIYQHSGVLPSDSDTRDGLLGIAAIPGHISHGRRKALSDDNWPWHPWLRLSMGTSAMELACIVLTKKQVIEFRDSLNSWLEKSA